MTKYEATDKLKMYLQKREPAHARKVAKSYISDLGLAVQKYMGPGVRGDDIDAVFIKGEEELLYLIGRVPEIYRCSLSEPELLGILLRHCRRVHRQVATYLAKACKEAKP